MVVADGVEGLVEDACEYEKVEEADVREAMSATKFRGVRVMPPERRAMLKDTTARKMRKVKSAFI